MYSQQSDFFLSQHQQYHHRSGWTTSQGDIYNTVSNYTSLAPPTHLSPSQQYPVVSSARQSYTFAQQQIAPRRQTLQVQRQIAPHHQPIQFQLAQVASTPNNNRGFFSIDRQHIFGQQKDADARVQEQVTMQALFVRQQKEAEARRINQQQEIARAAAAKRLQEEQARLENEQRRTQAQEQQEILREEAERQRAAQEEKHERENKLIRKEQLRKDRSALYRHYNVYLEYFPLGHGERRNPYLNNLLANRSMPIVSDSDLGLAIQYAKDNWEYYLEFPRDAKRATQWQKEKLAK
jgi:hypothetical protein